MLDRVNSFIFYKTGYACPPDVLQTELIPFLSLIDVTLHDSGKLTFDSFYFSFSHIFLCNIQIYHILGSDYAKFARCDIDDVTITYMSTPCKKCISISACVQKMHINDVTMKKYNEKVRHKKQVFIYYNNFSLIVYDK
jgi:hypothetical protein